jgi:hypothetical protein
MPLTPLTVTDLVIDFGAFNHTTSDVSNLTTLHLSNSTNPSSIIVGNRSSLPVTSVGDTTLPGPCYRNNIVDIFCTGKIHGGQDHTFLF